MWQQKKTWRRNSVTLHKFALIKFDIWSHKTPTLTLRRAQLTFRLLDDGAHIRLVSEETSCPSSPSSNVKSGCETQRVENWHKIEPVSGKLVPPGASARCRKENTRGGCKEVCVFVRVVGTSWKVEGRSGSARGCDEIHPSWREKGCACAAGSW